VRTQLAQRVNADVNRVLLPLAQSLLAQTSDIIRDTQEECEEYQLSLSGSAWNSPAIHLEQFPPPRASGFSSNVLSTRETAMDSSFTTLQTQHSQNGGPEIANAAHSGNADYNLRQPPQSFDSGYGPDSGNSQPSQITSTVPWQSNTPSDRQISLSQSQVHSMIKDHVKGAVSDLEKKFDNLQHTISLILPHMSSNSPHFLTMQPGNIGPQGGRGNVQPIENHTWNQETQHPVHRQERSVANLMELADATLGMPTMSPVTASRGIRDTYQNLQPTNGYVENELGNFLNLFD
jgi:hypothetical protein